MIYREINGVKIPALGFGTYELTGDICKRSLEAALEAGYRHIDTAEMYKNESQIGEVLSASDLSRNQLFLTSKVWFTNLQAVDLKKALHRSLDKLKTDYLDLYLIHWPVEGMDLEASIDTMKEAQSEGLIKFFGVSNFPPRLFSEAVQLGASVNQVEYHVLLSQQRLLDIATLNNILLTAYSPLGQSNLLSDKDIASIGEKYGKSAAQVALRWLLEQEQVMAIPRSSNPSNIKSNLDIFDFKLEDEDRAKLWAKNGNQRFIQPDFAPDWND